MGYMLKTCFSITKSLFVKQAAKTLMLKGHLKVHKIQHY